MAATINILVLVFVRDCYNGRYLFRVSDLMTLNKWWGGKIKTRKRDRISFKNQAREIPIVILTVPVAPSISQSFTSV